MVNKSLLELPRHPRAIDARTCVIQRRDTRKQSRMQQTAALFLIRRVQRLIVMPMIDEASDPVAHCTSDQRIGKKMFPTGEPRNAYRSGKTIHPNAN